MARRRRTRKTAASSAIVRRNPSPIKKRARRATAALGRAFGGLQFKKVLKDLPVSLLGMMAFKWSAKRFGGDNSAMQTDPESWSAMSYLKGAAGAVGAALLLNQIRPGTGQKCLEGAINLLAFQVLQNELIPKSEWATAQFGAEEDPYIPTEYQGLALAGETEDGPYMYGEDGEVYPADDGYRMQGYGSTLEPVGPLGSALEPVGPLGENNDPYSRAFFRN